ncbi:hypothetical protein [Natrinema sp. HArc-T2]|uniref:hypothetical protein n=1 Tax=Natrinema sp. HArc-T2 TaxID=3242701 RepID=UPI00359ED25C
MFGILWAVAAIGFVAAAGALFIDWDHWPLLVGTVAVFSLALTVLDYTVAYAGIVVNVGILAAVVYSHFM